MLINAQEEKSNEKISEVKLSTEIDCSSCEEKIKKQLAFTKGVVDVETSVEENTVIVKYRNKRTSVEKIIESLAEIDYKAEVVPEKTHTPRPRPKRSCCTM